jgi:hypothetical protein
LGSLHMNYRLAVFSPSRRLAGEPTFWLVMANQIGLFCYI